MLNDTDWYVNQLHCAGKKVKNLPEYMHGKSDSDMINYAKLKHYGLITKDRQCAEQARRYLSPVYLINVH